MSILIRVIIGSCFLKYLTSASYHNNNLIVIDSVIFQGQMTFL